jgi:hypothetical protein
MAPRAFEERGKTRQGEIKKIHLQNGAIDRNETTITF